MLRIGGVRELAKYESVRHRGDRIEEPLRLGGIRVGR